MTTETSEEPSLWKGSPSQWLNTGPFIMVGILTVAIITAGVFFPIALAGLIAPIVYGVWKYLIVKMEVFELTTERLLFTRGVLNQKVDEIELYRIKDSVLLRAWWMRPTHLASIHLETSDRTMPKLLIPAIYNGMEMRELLRKHVELQRDKKRVSELDFNEDAEMS